MSDVDGFGTWLRAQLDEVARVARAVPDHRQRNGELHWREIDPESQPGLVGDQCGNVVTFGGPSGTGRWHAAHIVRHDPARVLAEVDAKRRILDQCVTSLREESTLPYGGASSLAEDVLRLLALPYADRPGYRNEWRPE